MFEFMYVMLLYDIPIKSYKMYDLCKKYVSIRSKYQCYEISYCTVFTYIFIFLLCFLLFDMFSILFELSLW